MKVAVFGSGSFGTAMACGATGAGGGPASATENGRVQALGPHTAPLGMRFYNRTFAAGSAVWKYQHNAEYMGDGEVRCGRAARTAACRGRS